PHHHAGARRCLARRVRAVPRRDPAHDRQSRQAEALMAPDSKLDDAKITSQSGDAGPALLRGWLATAARTHPAKPYIVSVEDGRALSCQALAEIAARVAGHLAARGIGANGRVVLLANNSLEHLAVYIGVLAAGATICTVHVEMNRSHFDAILPALKPRLVLYE